MALTADKLDPKVNSLVFQSANAEHAPIDIGVMTAESVFKHWDPSKSQWTDDSCQVSLVTSQRAVLNKTYLEHCLQAPCGER